ncbi:GTP-binding protein Era [hydrothermal vent metagenome]|uniref:GTP-binding protein Era n=1 Tax=hydrothermal vent metagenome TaxID=652676 RepID=A0A3B0ZCY5_9ZZZZ
MSNLAEGFRCGYVAIVGRPNVGKSTLLNYILEQKISITAHKPQTTRHRILGVKTTQQAQIIYIDTPGMHMQGKRAMNRYLNRAASASIDDVNVVVFVVESDRWNGDDQMVLERLEKVEVPVILVVNKTDKIKQKSELLPVIESLSVKRKFAAVVPVSARNSDNLDRLQSEIEQLLPESKVMVFPEDQVTDRSMRFLAAELIREKLIRALGEELPYALTVEIEVFKEEKKRIHICARIWVERSGQKAIVIGKGGEVLKRIGSDARKDMNKLFDSRVHLELWVKVKEGWSDDERALRSLGYDDQ